MIMLDMLYNEDEVLSYINENDIKFIRLAFCDPFGVQKNVSIMPNEAERALKYGIPVDISEICSFCGGGKLLLKPDPSSFSLLPWRPSHGSVGRLFCRMLLPDGNPYEGDSRELLMSAMEDARRQGYVFSVGSECEFYLFNTDELGLPTAIPYDNAGYMDIAPLDKGENVRREICLTLEEMSITPESSHHAAGPGQHIITYKFADPLTSADNIMTYRWAVRTIAEKSGLHASFLPMPLEGGNPNDCRLLLIPSKLGQLDVSPDTVKAFADGIADKLPAMTMFLDSSEGSYKRLERLSERVTCDGGCVTVHTPDALINPYIAYTLLIRAGLEGGFDSAQALPANYAAAIEASNSDFIRSSLPGIFSDIYKNRSDSLRI